MKNKSKTTLMFVAIQIDIMSGIARASTQIHLAVVETAFLFRCDYLKKPI